MTVHNKLSKAQQGKSNNNPAVEMPTADGATTALLLWATFPQKPC